ncbi:DUF2798 domain-containing protein [Epibacterium ulvae]|uniref:DUF2798 domain-containing protein n=1 Tax=Epibacterium ulvae TaxID=1156985 RepID=UPI001BFCA229|nr:DUF2798 domain-containing protein [Epibacterium ulvae]MBT8153274.1 DUF2798 domain-containing protein [Epibacterium ulvae]
MIPARYAPILFGFLLSGIMSCLVTFIASVKNVGFGAQTISAWLGAWAFAWPVAFTIVLVVAPFVSRVVAKLVRDAESDL